MEYVKTQSEMFVPTPGTRCCLRFGEAIYVDKNGEKLVVFLC
jgi:hypothetical protein